LCAVTRQTRSVPRRKTRIPRDNAHRGGTKARRTSACCRSCCWASRRHFIFSKRGLDCAHRPRRTRLVGSFRALSSRSSSSTSLLTWVARMMIRRSRLSSLEATPKSCFLRREGDDLTCAHPLHLLRCDVRIRLIYFARFAVPVEILWCVTHPASRS